MADDDDGATDGASAPGKPSAATHVDPRSGSATGAGDINSYIGARLRQAFDDIASQPVPDRFLQLMQELDKA